METTVVQPGTSPAIFTTGHQGERHHDERFRETRLDADYRSQMAQGERYGVATGDRIHAVGAAGALASGHTDQLVQSGFGGVHDRICDSTGKVIGRMDTGFTAAALASCKTDDGVQAVGKDAVTLAKDAIIAQNVGFSAATVQAATIGSAGQVLATAFANQAQNTATMYANAQTVQTERVRAELALSQQVGFAAIALEAEKNAAAAALALCKCCGDQALEAAKNFAALQAQADRNTCDLKQLVTAEGVSGRALANEIEARRVQNELQRLQTQVLILTGGVIGSSAARAA